MKKKLLFINGHLKIGGVERALLDILRHIDYEKYTVDLLLLEGLGDYADQLPAQVRVVLCSIENTYGSVPASLLRCLRRHDWKNFRLRLIFLTMRLFGPKTIKPAARIMLGRHHYDTVIGYRQGICTQLAAFAVEADHRITWWHHGEFNVDEEAYHQQILCCDRVVSVSEACRKMLETHYPDQTEKIIVIPNMLDEAEIQKKAQAFDPYQHSTIEIVSVGRLSAEKHFCNAVWAAAWLKAAGVAFTWHVVGDGAERAALEKLIEEKALTANVILEGNQANPYPYISHADLFVHPSYVESQGIVVLEALGLGVPVVATRNDGVCEFLEDGVNAVLTEQSAEALAQEVQRVLETAELFSHIKTGACCPAKYQAESVAQQIGRLFIE